MNLPAAPGNTGSPGVERLPLIVMPLIIVTRMRFVRWTVAVTLVWGCCLLNARAGQAHFAASAQRQPVLVELFTSEGCSDCPPADALLAQLDSAQPFAGAEAIVLSEHVTYWNHQGWRDPFSLDTIDLRQQQYARQFALSDVYTPQIVVDGTEQFVGNDAAHLARAVVQAAGTAKPELSIENARVEADGSVEFSVHAASGAKGSLFAALAQNATTSIVARGENAGRTLHHVAVVRAIKEFGGKATDGRQLRLSGAQIAGADNSATPFRLVVFMVNGWNGHVTAVAEAILKAPVSTASAQPGR